MSALELLRQLRFDTESRPWGSRPTDDPSPAYADLASRSVIKIELDLFCVPEAGNRFVSAAEWFLEAWSGKGTAAVHAKNRQDAYREDRSNPFVQHQVELFGQDQDRALGNYEQAFKDGLGGWCRTGCLWSEVLGDSALESRGEPGLGSCWQGIRAAGRGSAFPQGLLGPSGGPELAWMGLLGVHRGVTV